MTIVTQLPYWGVTEIPEMEVMVYSGAAFDVAAVVAPWTDNPENLFFLVESLFFLVDLPFSLAGDTILLPLTISQTLEMQITAAMERHDAPK